MQIRTLASLFIAAFFFLLLISSDAWAQLSPVKFERLSVEHGLSQSTCSSIAQDKLGFMWFGTQDGLNRYDGYAFTVYRRNAFDTASLSDNYVTALLVDRSGTLWAGTRGGGLNRFLIESGKFIHYRNDPEETNTLSDDQITSLCEDKTGALWVGTSKGLNKLEPSSGKITRYFSNPSDPRSLPNNYIQSLFEDKNGRLWVGMIEAVALFDTEHDEFKRMHPPKSVKLFDGLAEDTEGAIWAATPQGVLSFSNNSWNIVFDSSIAKINHGILEDHDGFFWVGSNDGLLKIDPVLKKFDRYKRNADDPRSLSGNAVLSLFEDRTNILWVGTFEGINKYAPLKNRFKHIRWNGDELQSAGWNKVRGICEDNFGNYWIATQAGLEKYDKNLGRLERVDVLRGGSEGLGSNFFWAIREDRHAPSAANWIGTNGHGLVKMEFAERDGSMKPVYASYTHNEKDPHSIGSDVVMCIFESRSGTVWLGTLMEGLNAFDRKTNSFKHYRNDPLDPKSLSHNEVWSLCEDRTGAIWIGTAGGGLNKLEPGKNEFQRFQFSPDDTNSLSDNKVTAILEDKSGILWIGTYAGLNKLDPQKNLFTHYTTKDGLPNDVIYGILEDRQGNIWLSTNKGLSRFNPQLQTFRNYDAGDGLQSNEFNQGAAYYSRSGEMLFGGVNGFNIFFPESLQNNPSFPEVVFTDFKLFNASVQLSPTEHRLEKLISQADEVQLSYSDAVFSIEFAALEFTNPLKNQYAYMLEGFDKNWNYVGSKREATFTNLDPGEYIFRVKGSNNDGVWNEKGTSLRIIITPPWWGRWWFRGLLIVLFLTIGPSIYYFRISRMKKEQERQQHFSRQLIQSQEQERKRIAAELHDSVGQDLLIIKNKLLVEMESGDNAIDKQPSDLKNVVEYISKSLKNVREISRNLRPIQLDQLGLTTALESVLETIAESSRIKFTANLDNIDNVLTKENEINLFRIVQESLNNILKHSKATEVGVEVKRGEEVLTVIIKDNGIGIGLNKEQQRGFGMSSMKERSHILGGDLHIDSHSGTGTAVVIVIPLKNKSS